MSFLHIYNPRPSVVTQISVPGFGVVRIYRILSICRPKAHGCTRKCTTMPWTKRKAHDLQLTCMHTDLCRHLRAIATQLNIERIRPYCSKAIDSVRWGVVALWVLRDKRAHRPTKSSSDQQAAPQMPVDLINSYADFDA